MKKVLLILALIFTLNSNACIGSLGASDFHATGNFHNGYSYTIATMPDGQIHHMVYNEKGMFTNTIISHADAIKYAQSYEAQGFGDDGC